MTDNRLLPPAAYDDDALALRNAVSLWADATTDAGSARRGDLLRDKARAVAAFFAYAAKHPAHVLPADVKGWQREQERAGLSRATVYTRLSLLSSFFEWVMREPAFGRVLVSNPVRLSRPKAPRAYQTESTKALTDEELRSLLSAVRARARDAGAFVAKRDYALLLLYVLTGMRRGELIPLRGCDVELRDDALVIGGRVKGGDYVGREVRDPAARAALLDYLEASGRLNALGSERPLWTRHDRAGRPGAPLTSHAFARNMKVYAREAGIKDFHLHRTRHTFARLVAERTGSIVETQDALGHKNPATTRVYVQRIAVKRDKHSEEIARLLDLSGS
ncbi:MAG TPA: tyrosine-type recombinase/integrase [Pyrinomonadaceae bacterium]|nr:tyrosine-type recombinase/integrase [Pyrinomonadaceae bacterium]